MTLVGARRIDGRFWRMLAPRWAHQPLSGAGAERHGGRWNPIGTPALYMSEDFATAIAEYEQDLGIRPGTLCAYEAHVADVADLTDATTLAVLAIDPKIHHCDWKEILLVDKRDPPTWSVARQLIANGFAGVRVPSARGAGANLVFWSWNDAPERDIVALDPLGDLPRAARSWPTL